MTFGAYSGPAGRNIGRICGLLLTTALTTLLASIPVYPAKAQDASSPVVLGQASVEREFNIPAQPLTSALALFGQQSGLQITVDGDLARNVSTPGVQGRLASADALRRLLAGTGLGYSLSGATITLQKLSQVGMPGDVQLGTVRVRETPIDPAVTEGTRSYTAHAVTVGGKTARDPRQIQQSVSVVTAQQIQDQNLTTAQEALAQAPGITVATTNYQSIFSRGFEINSLQTDGGSPSVINNYGDYAGLPDLASYDHVEILRGSDGLFQGAGEAGGTVNLVRKRPLAHSQILFEGLAGSWDRYRGQLDVTGALDESGRVRARAVAAYTNKNFFYDVANDQRTVLYGIVEADVLAGTMLTLGGSYDQLNTLPNQLGIPRFSTGADLGLSRSTCLCAPWGRRDIQTGEIFVKVDHEFSADWTLKLNASQQQRTWDSKFGYLLGSVNPFTRATPALNGDNSRYSSRQTLVDLTLNGKFDLFGYQQEVVIGGNWQDVVLRGRSYNLVYATQPALSIFAFDPARWTEPGSSPFPAQVFNQLGQGQTGGYASLRSEILDDLHTVVGVRISSYRYRQAYDNLNATTGVKTSSVNNNFKESGIATPYGGITYDVSAAISLYGSYAQIFQSQANVLTVAGTPLEPVQGETYEIGAKGSWFDGSLTASLAGYQVERRNAALSTGTISGIPGCCYVAAAKIVSKGVDAEVTGSFIAGWDISLSYTFNENRYEEGYGANTGTAYMPRTPKHLAKLWTMVELPGELSSFRVGGGINAQSTTYAAGNATVFNANGVATGIAPYRFTQPGYAVVGLRGEYEINDKWSAAINLNNVFDESYFQTVSNANGRNFYGEPRNVMLSIRARY